MIKQFVPQEACLKCQGCCRFAKADSVWSPCLLDEEIQELLDKEIPPAYISADRRILPIADPQGEGFICAFLNAGENKCRIYAFRPFECQLYPFLINLRGQKVILTVDLNCPYVKDKLKTEAFKEYTEYLASFLNSPEQIRILKDNPQLLQAYEAVTDLVELDMIHEDKKIIP
ncbi:MAG: YkgJ family cysteine cluster protein [Candidatus Omnitrophica bacterium]|nr:YkgJ family cysteine cluster protein [Candidatus Omnitrophota bacterium]MDD5165955.1 YkgJ family cysteine cluster protein [Candidatus Omnitrophota bacterium]